MENSELYEWATANLEYRDGELWWKVRGPKRSLDRPISGVTKDGYSRVAKRVGLKLKPYFVHRLIFLMHHGYLPQYIDHIDGDRLNNRIENLRQATKSQNSFNRKAGISSSGVKGVHFHKAANMWCAKVTVNGQTIVRLHKDRELIDLVAREMREKYHGQFARHF